MSGAGGGHDDGATPVTRADLEALRRRVEALERAASPGDLAPCPRCGRHVRADRYCSACGSPLRAPPPEAPPAPRPAPPTPTPAAAPPRPPAQAEAPAPAVIYRAAATPAPRPPPPLPPPAPSPSPSRASTARPPRDLSLERVLGQRWAPRLGAMLVFLGVVFFLGVAVQRGWIGPVAQLALAATAGLGLVAAGAVLTARKGYGTFPQVLEATGACVLYVTAFVSHALPYYRDATGSTQVSSGMLMALVALGTVGLALRRDARVIAGLGYALAFVTALLGQDALPGITLPYVALLGTSLALLVARKGWLLEGAGGTLATGGFFVAFAARASAVGDPSPWLVAACALPPAAAFLFLAARRVEEEGGAEGPDASLAPPLVALLTLATFAWGVLATLPPVASRSAGGILALAWALAAGAHAAVGARTGAHPWARAAAGVAGVGLWIAGAPFVWLGAGEAALLVTLTYAAGALALALVPLRAAAWGGLALLLAAALHALLLEGRMGLPSGDGLAFAPWQAWATLAGVAVAAVALARRAEADEQARRAARMGLTVFAGAWTFALGETPFAVALGLVALAALSAADATRLPASRAAMRADAAASAVALAAAAAATTATFAPHLSDALLLAQGALALAALVGAFALAGSSRAGLGADARGAAHAVILLALLAWPLFHWRAASTGPLLATSSYALPALAFALLGRRAPAAAARTAAVALAGAAAVHAVLLQGSLHAPWRASADWIGPWQAWATLVLVGVPLAVVAAASASADARAQRLAASVAAAFAAAWAFALFHAPLAVTAWLLLVAAALAALGLRLRVEDESAGAGALGAALGLLGLAAVKAATLDMHVEAVRLDPAWAVVQAALVVGALLGAFHLARARDLAPPQSLTTLAAGLVGGSALVLVDLVLTYAEGALVSLLLGAVGVAYLAAGLALRGHQVYRYAGFAVLGLVLVRVFGVDLKETDLAVRALVFAALGAALLGIGYVYARMSKKEAAASPPQPSSPPEPLDEPEPR